MRQMNFDQQKNVFDPAMAKSVTLIGAGSVGSQLAVKLARLGCADLTVWDGDEVASHNIPMSEYRQGVDLMRLKVEALADIVKTATGISLTAIPKMYDGSPLKTSAVCASVDDMEARKNIWELVKQNPFVEIFVDTRVAAEYIEVFALRPCDPGDIAYYEHFLYPSAKALLNTCGWHGAIHVSGTAANAACAALTEWWQARIPKRHYRQLCGYFQEV